MTGPYQIIYSLEKVLDKHKDFKYSVKISHIGKFGASGVFKN